MLSEDERRRILEEETYRAAVQQELRGKAKPPSGGGRILRFLNSNVGAWFLGTVVVGSFGWAWTSCQARATAEARRISEERANNQQDTELVVELLPHLAQSGSPAGSLALGIVRHLRETNTIAPALSNILDAILADIARTSVQQADTEKEDPKRRRRYIATAEAAAAAIDKHAGPEDADLWRDLPKRAYIHIPVESQRKEGEALQSELRSMGLLTPGVQKVNVAPDRTEVRYFNDADKLSAEEIAKNVGGIAKKPQMFARQGQIEIWLGKK